MAAILYIVVSLIVGLVSAAIYFRSLSAYRAQQRHEEDRQQEEESQALLLTKEVPKSNIQYADTTNSDVPEELIQENSEFSTRLPFDVKLAVLTYAAEDDKTKISTLMLVCKEWKYIIDNEQIFWRNLMISHKSHWSALQQRQQQTDSSPSFTWKSRYIECYKASHPHPNTFRKGIPTRVPGHPLALKENPWPEPRWSLLNKIFRSDGNNGNNDTIPQGNFSLLAVLGRGVTDVVYKLIQQNPEECPFVQTGMYSGSLCIGSPIGVDVNGRETLVCGMRDPNDPNARVVPALWKARSRYLARADGIVFTLSGDCSDAGMEMDVARLNGILCHCTGGPGKRPVLILYKKNLGMSGYETAEKMCLFSVWGRRFTWRLQQYDPETLAELPVGFVWLLEESKRNADTKA